MSEGQEIRLICVLQSRPQYLPVASYLSQPKAEAEEEEEDSCDLQALPASPTHESGPEKVDLYSTLVF